jgi:hypothetical protein
VVWPYNLCTTNCTIFFVWLKLKWDWRSGSLPEGGCNEWKWKELGGYRVTRPLPHTSFTKEVGQIVCRAQRLYSLELGDFLRIKCSSLSCCSSGFYTLFTGKQTPDLAMSMVICTSVIVRTSVSWLMKMGHLFVCMCVFWICRSNFSVIFQVISVQKFGIWCYVEKYHDIAREGLSETL